MRNRRVTHRPGTGSRSVFTHLVHLDEEPAARTSGTKAFAELAQAPCPAMAPAADVEVGFLSFSHSQALPTAIYGPATVNRKRLAIDEPTSASGQQERECTRYVVWNCKSPHEIAEEDELIWCK